MIRADTADTSRIDKPWPASELETVEVCPYCDSPARSLAHSNVQDWSFYSAAGKWTYWSCNECESLYLSPRPTPVAIRNAYAAYYTHLLGGGASFIDRLKERIANELWSHFFRKDLRPRIHLPSSLRWPMRPLLKRLTVPFQLAELAKCVPGRLLDVGCGNGYMLVVAEQLGWQATGLEIDPTAVRTARSKQLDVLEGSYERLSEFEEEYDCIICSHVLEHVHDPRDMLRRMASALKPGGLLLLSLPNATSLVRRHFDTNWRGLEAPRHVTIPSMRQLRVTLQNMGLRVDPKPLTKLSTAAESFRIQRRGTRVTVRDRALAKKLSAQLLPTSEEFSDYTQFACRKVSPADDQFLELDEVNLTATTAAPAVAAAHLG